MVDNKSNDVPEGSFLKTAVAATPFATGVGLSVRNMMHDRTVAPRESPIQRAAGTLGRIQGLRAAPVDPKVHIQWMNRQAKFFAGEGAAIAKTAWIQAVQSADPLSRDAIGLLGKSITDLPAEHVSSAITQVMAEQQSDLAQSVYRRFYRNVTALSEQQFAGGATFAFSTLGGEALTAPAPFEVPNAAIREQIANIEKALGAAPDSTLMEYFSRQPWRAEGLGTYSLKFRSQIGDINLLLPTVSDRGILTAGMTQQTRYIAPSVGIYDPATKELQRMSRTEFLLREFQESILPDIQSGKLTSRKDVERAVSEMERRVIHTLETVPNIPYEYKTTAGRLYEQIRGKAMDVVIKQERYTGEGPWRYTSAFRTPTERELADAMATHKLYGGVGPTGLSKGRVMTEDLSRIALVPEAVSWARRPEAAYREFGLTDAARVSMSTEELKRYSRYRKYETSASRAMETQLSNPHLKAMYVDPDKYLELMERIEMGEGEALARKGLRDLLEFEAAKTQKLSVVREDILASLRAGEVPELAHGEIIGWTPEGDPFKMSRDMRIQRGIEHASKSQGEFMMLHYMDTKRLQSNDKLFGDLKAVTRLMDDKAFDRRVSAIAQNTRISDGVDILINMDELRKDPGKHVKQMTTALGEVLRARENVVTPPLLKFMESPEDITDIFKKLSVREGRLYEHERYIQEMMKFATEQADVTAKEFGSIFGAVPAVVGSEEKALQLMREALGERQALEHEKEMLKRIAGGVAKIAYGGPAEITGAGAMGSIEPRVFELLSSQHYGNIGAELSEDFVRRMAYTNPEKLAVHETLAKTLMSMEGGAGRKAGEAVWEAGKPGYTYKASEFQKWIEKGGGWLKPGQGLNEIYVPGAATIKAMRPYQVGDQAIRGDLSDVFHKLAQRADQMYASGAAIGAQDMKAEMESAARILQKQWAPAGKGMGSYLRGKMVGSRFMRGVSRSGNVGMTQLAEESANLMVAGIPRSAAKEMFGEMERAGLWDPNKLAAMRERAMAGEEFGGILMRHPVIGPFSAQQMRFRVMDMPGENIVLPEKTVDLRIRRGGELIDKKVKLGPLVGLAGDKDADIFSAILVSPDSEKAVRQATLAADSEFLNRYTQHQVRYQLLKAGKASAGDTLLSVEEKMLADVSKLGTTQRWVPRLSLELSAAKKALGATATGAGAADAAMLLEWLEQTPISAKHLSASEVRSGRLESLLGEITSSIQYGDAKRLQGAVHSIIKDDAVANQLLTGNIQIEEGSQQIAQFMGGKAQKEIRGINLERATKTLMASMEEYRVTGEARRAEVLAGRGAGMTMREIPEVVAKQMAHMSAGVQGVFSSVSRAANTAANVAGSLGRGILKHHKALGLGFAGSLALGAILSSPPSQIGPGGGLIPKNIKLNVGKGANRMRPEDVMPPQQEIGQPTPPNMLNMRRAMVSGAGPHPQVNVRARARYMIDGNRLSQGIAAAGGQGRRVNVNLRDSRAGLNPHILANKLL